jgi:hypothetical protein
MLTVFLRRAGSDDQPATSAGKRSGEAGCVVVGGVESSLRRSLKRIAFTRSYGLPFRPNYREREQQDFSVENAVSYLLRLPWLERQKAFEYVRKAPEEVQTPVRIRLKQLGIV